MKSSIRIGAAQGFWGDRRDAPEALARHGKCDYLMLDYLAEVTMSILQRQKMRDPALGYALTTRVLSATLQRLERTEWSV